MSLVNRTPLKAAFAVAAVLALCEAAHLAAEARGVPAGVAVIAVTFLACWAGRQLRQVYRHPLPQRPAPVRLPEAAQREPEPAGLAS